MLHKEALVSILVLRSTIIDEVIINLILMFATSKVGVLEFFWVMHASDLVLFFFKLVISSLSDFTWSMRTRLRFNESDARCTAWFSFYLQVLGCSFFVSFLFLLFLQCRIMRPFRIRSTSHPIQDHTPVCLLLCYVHIFFTSRAYTWGTFLRGAQPWCLGSFCTKYKS